MATVEVACDVHDFAQLIHDDVLEFQIEPAGKSPPGVQWFIVFVDFSKGERRAARTAWAVLAALQRSAEAGCIAGFRVIDGQRWLALETASTTSEREVKLLRSALGDASVDAG